MRTQVHLTALPMGSGTVIKLTVLETVNGVHKRPLITKEWDTSLPSDLPEGLEHNHLVQVMYAALIKAQELYEDQHPGMVRDALRGGPQRDFGL